MKMTIKGALAIAATSIFVPCTLLRAQGTPAPAESAPERSARLQGTWEGVEVGREVQGKCTMTIAANSLHFQGSNKNEWYKATFTLPPDTDPKQLVASITECPSPEFVGKSSFAIYKIEDGTLTLAGREPGAPDAPKDFAGDPATRTFVFKKAQEQKQNIESPKSKSPSTK